MSLIFKSDSRIESDWLDAEDAHRLWWFFGYMQALAASCSVLLSVTGPPFDREGVELHWRPYGQVDIHT